MKSTLPRTVLFSNTYMIPQYPSKILLSPTSVILSHNIILHMFLLPDMLFLLFCLAHTSYLKFLLSWAFYVVAPLNFLTLHLPGLHCTLLIFPL